MEGGIDKREDGFRGRQDGCSEVGLRMVRWLRASTLGGIQGASFHTKMQVNNKKEEKNVVTGASCNTGGTSKERIFVKFDN